MGVSVKSLGIDRLSIDERLALMEELWESIAADSAALSPTEAQCAELDRRLAGHDANPEAASAWDEVKQALIPLPNR
jgi:putative addiction module component (TIGR02574 family)